MPSLCFLINCVLCLVAVIFVIDSNNIERITEAHEELAKLMAEKRLKDALLLIYANKQVQIVQLLFLAVVSLHVYLQFEWFDKIFLLKRIEIQFSFRCSRYH